MHTIDRRLADIRALAVTVGISGTPGFLIGDVLVPGYIDATQAEQLVQQARQTCTTCGKPAGG